MLFKNMRRFRHTLFRIYPKESTVLELLNIIGHRLD